MRYLLCTLFVAIAGAQSLTLSISPVKIKPGGAVTVTASLAVSLPATAAAIGATLPTAGSNPIAGPDATAAGKSLASNPANGRLLIEGLNQTAIPAGPLFSFTYTAPAARGTAWVSLSEVLGASPDGAAVAIASPAASFKVCTRRLFPPFALRCYP
jgi:hypothetical protein